MNVGRALLCLVAMPVMCVALATPVRAQGFLGPISFGGPGPGGSGDD